MMTSSFGIIIRLRNRANSRPFPLNSSRAKANAAGTITSIISPVVTTVKISVLMKYRPRLTSVNALT